MADRLFIAAIVMAAGVALFLLFQRRQQSRATLAVRPNGRSTVLYFRSDTCAPCIAQARILDQLRGQMGDRVMIEKIDADVDRESADRFGIFTVPTTLIVNAAGQVRHANYGLADSTKLAAQLREM